MTDQTGPAGLTDEQIADLREWHEPHAATPVAAACETCGLLTALSAALARAEAAEKDRGFWKAAQVATCNKLVEIMADRDRERRRAEEAEARVKAADALLWGVLGGLDESDGPQTTPIGRTAQITGYEAFHTLGLITEIRDFLRAALSADAGWGEGES